MKVVTAKIFLAENVNEAARELLKDRCLIPERATEIVGRPVWTSIKYAKRYARLKAFDVNRDSPSSVADIIGWRSAIKLLCSECGRERDSMISIDAGVYGCEYCAEDGGEMQAEVWICADCLGGALELLDTFAKLDAYHPGVK